MTNVVKLPVIGDREFVQQEFSDEMYRVWDEIALARDVLLADRSVGIELRQKIRKALYKARLELMRAAKLAERER